MNKKKVMYSIYNSSKIGGPNNAMKRMAHSFLQDRYDFVPIIIDDHLGNLPRIKVVRRLVKEIREEKPDIIYFTGMQLQGFYMAVASFLAGYRKKTIMVVRGSACDAIEISRFNRLIFRWFIEPVSVRLAYMTHTVCTEMANNPIVKDNVRNFGGVIYNAAPDIGDVQYSRDEFRTEIQADSDDILLVYTGRLHSDKGIAYLIDALQNTEEKIKLILIGSGPHKEMFMNQVKNRNLSDRVYFLGDRQDVIRILFGCDIFVFPTLHENLSNSVLEACAVGLPVIATKVGGNQEIIRDGIEGRIVPAKDFVAFREAIISLSTNNSLRTEFGSRARLRAQTVFSAREIYTKLYGLFDIIMNFKY